jgi:cell division septum initiation protein DivIVA
MAPVASTTTSTRPKRAGAEIRAVADPRDELETRLRGIDRQIAQREQRLESLHEQRRTVQREIERLETRLAGSDEVEDTGHVDRYQRLNDLEYERGQLEQRLSELDTERDEIEGLADGKTRLEARRDDLRDEIDALRSRDDAVYEDTVETLSASEREIIGLVVALAGYLVHDVRAGIPFVLLDSLESIDANRIGDFLDYFAGETPYLVVALRPDDAETIDIEHDRVLAGPPGTYPPRTSPFLYAMECKASRRCWFAIRRRKVTL